MGKIGKGSVLAEFCSICGCSLHRNGNYAAPTIEGRSHATQHHFVPERFFGRSSNRRGTQRDTIFEKCPWNMEGTKDVFCYECHEELVHNPVFLPEDIEKFARLVRLRGLSEETKTASRDKIGERIKLLHEVIARGVDELLKEQS